MSDFYEKLSFLGSKSGERTQIKGAMSKEEYIQTMEALEEEERDFMMLIARKDENLLSPEDTRRLQAHIEKV